MKRIILVALVFALALPVQAQNPDADKMDKAFDAYEAGNYAKAFKVWLPLAKKGISTAQYHLSILYSEGKGVKKDETEAVKWLLLAAEQRYPIAQSDLGYHYINGFGVKRDYVQAYVWFGFAALNLAIMKREEDEKMAAENRDIAARFMTQSQIEEAQRIGSETLLRRVVGPGAGWR